MHASSIRSQHVQFAIIFVSMFILGMVLVSHLQHTLFALKPDTSLALQSDSGNTDQSTYIPDPVSTVAQATAPPDTTGGCGCPACCALN